MDNFYLNEIVAEIAPVIRGRLITRISMDGTDLRLDFGGSRLGLVARLAGDDPALFLASERSGKTTAKRSGVDAERTVSGSGYRFLLQLRSKLVGAGLTSIDKDPYDRVVRITLRPTDESATPGSEVSLILILTGRSVNALLTGTSGLIEIALKEAGPIQIGSPPPPPRIVALDPSALPDIADQALTPDDILGSCFRSGSTPFGKLYQMEFLFRCSSSSPSLALRSLLEDLFIRKRKPIIYTSVLLDHLVEGALNLEPVRRPATAERTSATEIGSPAGVPSPGSDLILSCIELATAEGLARYEFASFSKAAEIYSEAIATAKSWRERHRRLSSALEGRLKKLRAARRSIESDLARFSDAAKLKRSGDLLLANLSTARTEHGVAIVKDYYDAGEPFIEIEIPKDQTLQQAAADYYQRSQKATRAIKTLGPRAKEIGKQISRTEELLASLQQQPDIKRIEEVEASSGFRRDAGPGLRSRTSTAGRGAPAGRRKSSRGQRVGIGRRFLSSDGYEIVVGRNDAENDAITFKVAGSLDVWLHAADYPGSHVVVRNPSRRPVPQRSIVEAARIAAFYSQARRQGKAAVNYTQKKFVSKAPKAKPGLVRLSSFKTLLVEPTIPSALDQSNEEF